MFILLDHIERPIHYNYVIVWVFHIDMFEYSSSHTVHIHPHDTLVHIDVVDKTKLSNKLFHMTNLWNHTDVLLD